MLAAMPVTDAEELHKHGRDVWAQMTENDWLEAFAGHPKIGDVNSLKAKYAATRDLAGHEQQSVQQADDAVIGETELGADSGGNGPAHRSQKGR